jgi:hypothetical protein
MMVVQEKTQSYVKQTSSDDFIPLTIKMYECIHSCFDSIFIVCAQTTITRHQWSFLVPLIRVSYY